MARMMDQISATNHRIEHGLTPQTPQQPMVTMQEIILMETPKVQRPHDIAYHDLMTSSSHKGVSPGSPANTPVTTPQSLEESMEKLLTSMGSFLTHSKKDDNTTELPKFHGGDAQWPQWYQLLRSYLQAKGWLDHVTGPGTLAHPTPDFDLDKNTKIYQKLHSKCYEGTASTYVRMAAEFDGHGAGQQFKRMLQQRMLQQKVSPTT
jgi:hypothetical protein